MVARTLQQSPTNLDGSRTATKKQRKKPVFIVTTDTMVENPIVSNWVESSLEKMKITAKENDLPIKPYLIKPKLEDRFWVNLIGKGYLLQEEVLGGVLID